MMFYQLQHSFPDNTFQEHRYTMAATIEKFVGADITDEIIAQAADLFSLHYGVWGSIAKEKMEVHEGKTSPLLKSYHRELPPDCGHSSHTQISLTEVDLGSRVKMSLGKLREQVLPPFKSPNCKHIYVRGLLPSTPSAYHPPFSVGHVFATRFLHNNRPVLWITQLVVHSAHRNQGIAKALLEALREENAQMVGVLSSNPYAIAAVLRAFGSGLERVEKVLEMTRRNATRVD
jgi:GNAT superfamily N-acetyltransferase